MFKKIEYFNNYKQMLKFFFKGFYEESSNSFSNKKSSTIDYTSKIKKAQDILSILNNQKRNQ